LPPLPFPSTSSVNASGGCSSAMRACPVYVPLMLPNPTLMRASYAPRSLRTRLSQPSMQRQRTAGSRSTLNTRSGGRGRRYVAVSFNRLETGRLTQGSGGVDLREVRTVLGRRVHIVERLNAFGGRV